MKIAALISVRDKSTRFPGKILKPLHGQPVFEHLIDRIKTATKIDRVVIATSDDPRDAVFGPIAERKGIEVFYGSQADKLKRYLDALTHLDMQAAIVIDGDDILAFPEIVDATADRLRQGSCDVVMWRGLPLGAASSGLTRNALAKIMDLKNEEDTEVWGGYFTRPGLFEVAYMDPDDALLAHPEVRMTLDYQEDFDFLEKIFDHLKNNKFSSRELMDVLINQHPEWNEITKPAQERYLANIQKAAPVKMKTENTPR